MPRLWLFALLACVVNAADDNPYVGAEACASCHATQFDKQSGSHHARALRPIRDSAVYPWLAAAGGNTAALLQWAFGAGVQGTTPVGVYQGRYFESRYSFYARPQQLAITFGHPKRVSTPEAELGVMQDDKTIAQCFGCHSTGMPSGSLDLATMRPGVTCERCHGPGRAHVMAANSKATPEVVRRALVNPKRFPAKAQVELCGECHRLPTPGSDSPEPEIEDPVSVRFSPIGLLASRCFVQSKGLSCSTCHDAHEDVRPRSDPGYVARCSGCHNASVAARSHCPRATDRNCLSCHMQQTALGPYLRFTDHRIRVYGR